MRRLIRVLLTGLFLFSQVQLGYCAVELDYMEAYTTDALAQVAYVTDSSLRSNADIDDEDMADITDWADVDTGGGESSQVTFDGKSCMKLDTKTSATTWDSASRKQDIGSFGARTVFSFPTYFSAIGEDNDDFIVRIWNGTIYLNISFRPSGLYIHNGSSMVEVGTDLVVQGVWQEWTFDVNWTAKTVDVYLGKVLKASGVNCNAPNTDEAEGMVLFRQWGYITSNRITYIDWFKAGSGLDWLQCYSEATIVQQGSYSLKVFAIATDSLNDTLTRTVSPTIDLTGQTLWEFYIYSSRTGSNIKLGIKDSGGTSTETTPNVTSSGAWQKVSVDISGVSDANKDAISEIKATIVNADSDNTFYLDNMYGEFISIWKPKAVIF